MARNFLSYPFAPYNGAYTSKPFNNGRGGQKGVLVATDIVWSTYQANGQNLGSLNPNFCVTVNLNTAGPSTVSGTWTVQSVYIDNEGVDFPVYVYFPDSLFAISCPANAAGWYAVYTNARQALICGVGISDSAISAQQRSRLFFTDVIMVPSLDEERPSSVPLYLGSPLIQRTNSLLPGFGPPALGDQTISGNLNAIIGTPLPITSIILPKTTSGFYYITVLFITAPLIQAQFSSAQGGIVFSAEFDDLTSGVSIAQFQLYSFQVPNSNNFNTNNPVLVSGQNMNLRLDATHDYGFKLTNVQNVPPGVLSSYQLSLQAFIAYTLNPN